MKQVWNWIGASSIRLFIVLALTVLISILFLDALDDKFNYHDILVEAHGVIFDIVIFGIILAIYDNFRAKKERIERYQAELDDFRGWDSDYAMFRNLGNLKRLNNEGVSAVNLSYLNLNKAAMWQCDLRDANLTETNLYKAFLREADLSNANLRGANMIEAILTNAKLAQADLSNADLTNAILWETDFHGVKFSETVLVGAKVKARNWIKQLAEWEVEGYEEIKKLYTIDHTPVEIDIPNFGKIKCYSLREKFV